jgi:uncharacterized membrane protein YhfC
MDILYLTYPLAILIIIGMAVGLGLFLKRRFNLTWRLYLIGAAVFLLSQVFHIPFNIGLGLLMERGVLPPPAPEYTVLFQIIFLGLSAGLFEEGARYLMYRFWTREARSWGKGLMIGAGHGAGGEAMIFVGLILLVNFLAMVAFRNSDLAGMVSPAQLESLEQQVIGYWSVPWYDSLIPALERAFAIILHLSLSVLVLQVFTRRQIYWLGLAILWHALANAVALYAAMTWSIYHSEAALGVISLLSLGIIFALRTPEPPESQAPDSPPPPPGPLSKVEIENESERLDDSRFS